MNYYNNDIDEIYEALETSYDGINENQAVERIRKYGPNQLEERKKKSKVRKFFDQFNDMMIIILIIVAVIMGLYGIFYTHDYTDTIVISIVVIINAIMGFIQEEKAEVTLEGLKKYNTSSCKVKCDGKIVVIDSKKIVPGDIIILEAGDKIPADARIISATSLKIDESPLTGESVPVTKTNKKLVGIKPIQEQTNMLFSGCSVVNGKAEAVVIKTAMNTELGLIATSLDTPYEVETPLQIKIKEISKSITLFVFLVLLFMFVYGVLNGYKLMELTLLCVSLAVAAIPEGLPAVITIALSCGTGALAKKKTVVRQMSAVETLGSTDIICSDKTGTITQNKMTVKETVILDEEKFKYIALLANETIIDRKKYIGDPTETCLFSYFEKNIDIEKFIKTNPRVTELPFDSDRKMMSSVNQVNDKNFLYTKGSLENLLEKCKYIINDGNIVKITEKDKKELIKKEQEMASKALRVLGFAYKETDIENIKEDDLIYVGMVGMIDPPRIDVKKAVEKCKTAGIRPVMITGDSLVTACAIAKEVGIIENSDEGILGSELDKYTDEELKEVVKKYSVYARVSPTHKVRIVAAWQKNGKVVGMTGDGVNDAPAIKDAHVGIGMGITGTEVTKSVADVILLDDSFSTIVVAVEEGRRIFTNIRNNVVYSLSSNIAELVIVLIGMFTGNTILLPIHILFIDLVTDSIPSICLSFEQSEKNIMKKNPRGIDKPLFTPYVKANIVYSAIVETIFALATYFIVIANNGGQATAATLALLSVVIQEIIYAVSCRNLNSFIYKQGFLSNKAMNIGLLTVIGVELIFFLTPVGSLIGIESLSIILILETFIFNIIGFFIYELGKPLLSKFFND